MNGLSGARNFWQRLRDRAIKLGKSSIPNIDDTFDEVSDKAKEMSKIAELNIVV
jgi:hypothetical protein